MSCWYQRANFYHIYILGLCGVEFRNDYGSAQKRLGEVARWIPHIKEMGCNAVYFSPVFKWANDETLHAVTNYELYKGLYSSHNDRNLFELAYSLNRQFNTEDGVYKNLCLYNFADNHDQSRLASAVSCSAHLYTVYILLYTMPGIPSLYYGSEWGIRGVKTDGSDEQLRPYIDLDSTDASETDLVTPLQIWAGITRISTIC